MRTEPTWIELVPSTQITTSNQQYPEIGRFVPTDTSPVSNLGLLKLVAMFVKQLNTVALTFLTKQESKGHSSQCVWDHQTGGL